MAFLDTAIVALRESLEALLILGILLGIAVKTGSPGARRPLLWGALAALAVSIILGIAAQGAANQLYEDNAALFEGGASLLAVAILTYMIIWMYRHTQGMMGALHHKTKDAIAGGRMFALAGVAFVAVLREGIETVVFTASKFPTDGTATTLIALAAGIAVSGIIAFLVFTGFLKLSIERFMAATGLILVVIAAGLFAYGVHETREAGVFDDNSGLAYDLRNTLPHKGFPDDKTTPDVNEAIIDTPAEATGAFLHGLVVYRANPTWLEVASYWAYLLPMGAWVISRLFKGRSKPHDGPSPATGTQTQAPASTAAPAPSPPRSGFAEPEGQAPLQLAAPVRTPRGTALVAVRL